MASSLHVDISNMDVKQRVGKKWFASESAANESYLCFLGGETQPNMAKADGMVAELVVGLALATAEYGQRHSQDTLTSRYHFAKSIRGF